MRQKVSDLLKEKQRLEQDNDDLERRVRMSDATIRHIQEQLDKVLEENAILHVDLDDLRASSTEVSQRLKEELRGLSLSLLLSFPSVAFCLCRFTNISSSAPPPPPPPDQKNELHVRTNELEKLRKLFVCCLLSFLLFSCFISSHTPSPFLRRNTQKSAFDITALTDTTVLSPFSILDDVIDSIAVRVFRSLSISFFRAQFGREKDEN